MGLQLRLSPGGLACPLILCFGFRAGGPLGSSKVAPVGPVEMSGGGGCMSTALSTA